MTSFPLVNQVLETARWTRVAAEHADRADALTADRRRRAARHEVDEVDDFLYTYYPVRPARLRRWHPGVGTALAGSPDEIAERLTWRWHTAISHGTDSRSADQAAPLAAPHAHREHVVLHAGHMLADRADSVQRIRRVLATTAERPPALGCLGLHEWAMVYRPDGTLRHTLPLRLGQQKTEEFLESRTIRCTHFDAFRFFTPAARPRNTLQPTPTQRSNGEQPGCLHANMDLLRHALALGPAVPGDLLLDCLDLARDIRILDMEASPYDVRTRGYGVVPIETSAGRAQYVARQQAFSERSRPLRTRLLAVCDALLQHAPEGDDPR